MSEYARIAAAIRFIASQVAHQPTLDEIAAHVHLSPFHFQRLFSRWAGVTPKRYLQVLTLERAKALLQESRPLLEVADTLGLSSGSRLYDHFVQLEAVTPGEARRRGEGLTLRWGLAPTPFGRGLFAIAPRGLAGLRHERRRGPSAQVPAAPGQQQEQSRQRRSDRLLRRDPQPQPDPAGGRAGGRG